MRTAALCTLGLGAIVSATSCLNIEESSKKGPAMDLFQSKSQDNGVIHTLSETQTDEEKRNEAYQKYMEQYNRINSDISDFYSFSQQNNLQGMTNQFNAMKRHVSEFRRVRSNTNLEAMLYQSMSWSEVRSMMAQQDANLNSQLDSMRNHIRYAKTVIPINETIGMKEEVGGIVSEDMHYLNRKFKKKDLQFSTNTTRTLEDALARSERYMELAQSSSNVVLEEHVHDLRGNIFFSMQDYGRANSEFSQMAKHLLESRESTNDNKYILRATGIVTNMCNQLSAIDQEYNKSLLPYSKGACKMREVLVLGEAYKLLRDGNQFPAMQRLILMKMKDLYDEVAEKYSNHDCFNSYFVRMNENYADILHSMNNFPAAMKMYGNAMSRVPFSSEMDRLDEDALKLKFGKELMITGHYKNALQQFNTMKTKAFATNPATRYFRTSTSNAIRRGMELAQNSNVIFSKDNYLVIVSDGRTNVFSRMIVETEDSPLRRVMLVQSTNGWTPLSPKDETNMIIRPLSGKGVAQTNIQALESLVAYPHSEVESGNRFWIASLGSGKQYFMDSNGDRKSSIYFEGLFNLVVDKNSYSASAGWKAGNIAFAKAGYSRTIEGKDAVYVVNPNVCVQLLTNKSILADLTFSFKQSPRFKDYSIMEDIGLTSAGALVLGLEAEYYQNEYLKHSLNVSGKLQNLLKNGLDITKLDFSDPEQMKMLWTGIEYSLTIYDPRKKIREDLAGCTFLESNPRNIYIRASANPFEGTVGAEARYKVLWFVDLYAKVGNPDGKSKLEMLNNPLPSAGVRVDIVQGLAFIASLFGADDEIYKLLPYYSGIRPKIEIDAVKAAATGGAGVFNLTF